MREKIVALQVLRFVACSGVILRHASVLPRSLSRVAVGHPAAPVWEVGAAGVDIFFVISGFVIALTGPLANPAPAPLVFLWRRWRRVAPVFFLLSMVQVLIFKPRLEWSRSLATLSFWLVYGHRIVVPYLENGWTLCLEMLFYMSVTVFLAIPRPRTGLIVGAVGMAGLIWLRTSVGGAALRFIVNPAFLEFGAGVLLALVWNRLKKIPVDIGTFLVAIAVATFVIETFVGSAGVGDRSTFLENQSALLRDLAFGVPSLALVTGVLIVGREWRGALVRPFEHLGDASYSLYLTHPLTNAFIDAMLRGHRPQAWLVMGVSVVLAFSSGLFVYLILERPMLAWLRTCRLSRKDRPSALLPANL